jgi:hypothetical protein
LSCLVLSCLVLLCRVLSVVSSYGPDGLVHQRERTDPAQLGTVHPLEGGKRVIGVGL